MRLITALTLEENSREHRASPADTDKTSLEFLLLRKLARGTPLLNLRVDYFNLLDSLKTSMQSAIEEAQQDKKSVVLESQDPIPLKGDSLAIEYVLQNLIARAIRQSSPGGRIVLDSERIHVVVQELNSRSSFFMDQKGDFKLELCLRLIEAHHGHLEISAFLKGSGVEYTIQLPTPAQ